MEFDVSAFAEMNKYAREIGTQNERYQRNARIQNPDSARNAQNRVAAEQASYTQVLGELSAELPYGELGEAYIALHQELEDVLAGAGDKLVMRRLAVIALAGRLAEECYPDRRDEIERNMHIRIAELTLEADAEAIDRVAELASQLDRLTEVYELAGQAWPAPLAVRVPEPIKEIAKQREVSLVPGEGEDPSANFDGSLIDNELSAVERAERRWGTHVIDQPEASKLIALFLVENRGQIVSVDELASFVYAGTASDGQGARLRSRITTILGPKIQGERIQKLLKLEGLNLEYGWRVTNGSKRRVYKAVSGYEPVLEQAPA